MDNLYLYGVTMGSDISLPMTGVGGGDSIYTVEYRQFGAVVSDVGTTDPEQTNEALERHNEVLQAVLESGETVIPMRFGMAFNDERTLKSVLRGAQQAFRRTYEEIEGTVELGLKLVAGPNGSVNREETRSAVSDRVEDIIVGQTEDDLFSDRLVLNRSYLVERANREAFNNAVDDIEAFDESLTVQYTGPWPPYNFVDIQIGAEGQR